MFEKSSLRNRCVILLLLVFGLLLGAASAQTESVLYSFCEQSHCTDGSRPYAGVVLDQNGNLYGTTFFGGAYNGSCGSGCGVVFQLTLKGKYSVLYSYCVQTVCADGQYPEAGVVFDQKGNLYGTTVLGGANHNSTCDSGYGYGCGVVFKLTPKGKETVLYSFCAKDNCSDGWGPVAGLTLDQNGNLYGTTSYGALWLCGESDVGCVVFKLTPKGKEIVLYSFCAQKDCTDGAGPIAGLTLDQKGNLYGTTAGGGAHYRGVVFRLTPEGKETVLHSFCAQANCSDGAIPSAGVVFDQKGNLYGTTTGGGAHEGGVVFRLTPEGKYSVLYSFCAENNCADGQYPEAGVVFDQKGNLYGTTYSGGAYNNYDICDNGGGYGCGVVFKLTPKGKETVLYSFCAQANCTDGAEPVAGLAFDRNGDLDGTALSGGAHGYGAIFKLTP
jgi:uncharacterized repeat protein (TIGR03803 family)